MNASRRPLLAGLASTTVVRGAWAQANYPSRPIRVIVPFGAGGGTDNLIRLLEPHVTRSLGQPLVIETRPGAGGIIGTEVVARAEPDGHTLLAIDTTFVINPGLFPSLPYDPARDFEPVTLLARAPVVLIVHPSVSARTLQELIALAKAHPGSLSYASGGLGSPVHIVGEMLKAEAGVRINHVPYRGTGPAMNDIIAGHVQIGFNGLSASRPHILSGRVRALAVTGDRRADAFPDVPTFAELGLPGVELYTHWGVLVRAGTPESMIAKLADAFDQAVRRPDLLARLTELGYVPAGSGPVVYAETIRRETAKFTAVIRAANIRPE
jgi:tripartite-type tricarboxylate transporter receptor subunit TctC